MAELKRFSLPCLVAGATVTAVVNASVEELTSGQETKIDHPCAGCKACGNNRGPRKQIVVDTSMLYQPYFDEAGEISVSQCYPADRVVGTTQKSGH